MIEADRSDRFYREILLINIEWRISEIRKTHCELSIKMINERESYYEETLIIYRRGIIVIIHESGIRRK